MKKGFSLLEIIIVITLLAVLATVILVAIDFPRRIEESQKSRAVFEMRQLANAAEAFFIDRGYWPADVNRSLPSELQEYLPPGFSWPDGPIEGATWDYDNWTGLSCINSDADNSIQITLREIPNRNPDGSDTWAWYIPLNPDAPGAPHCNNASEYDKGECITCAGFSL